MRHIESGGCVSIGEARPQADYNRDRSAAVVVDVGDLPQQGCVVTRPKLQATCTVVVTDTDTNITNTVDLDAVLEYGPGLDSGPGLDLGPGLDSDPGLEPCPGLDSGPGMDSGPGLDPCPGLDSGPGCDVVSCASLVDTSNIHGVLEFCDSTDCTSPLVPGSEVTMGACSPFCQNTPFVEYSEDVVSYQAEAMYDENVLAGGEMYTMYTDSTGALSYGDTNILASPNFTTTHDLGYSSDTEASLHYMNPSSHPSDGTNITVSANPMMMPQVGLPTCPHGYPTVASTPVVVQASDVPLCSPPCTPDSSTILARVYNTIAPLQCTLPPDCTLSRHSTRGHANISDNMDARMSAAEQTFTILESTTPTPSSPDETTPNSPVTTEVDHSTSSSPLHFSRYLPETATIITNNLIPMATIPNTTATIPAVITSTSELAGCSTPSSPTTALQFRVQLKEFAFVGSCLKIAAKVSVTEEDADFWKHMDPGDVYFFSANSYVLCVQRSKQKKVTFIWYAPFIMYPNYQTLGISGDL